MRSSYPRPSPPVINFTLKLDYFYPHMLHEYLPVLFQGSIAIGFAISTLLLSVVFGRTSRHNDVKHTPYECGMLPQGQAQPRFSVKFYLVAMLFILFDIEVVFMYPWAVVYKDYIATFGPIIFLSMLGFIIIIFVGYLYALKKGVLNWAH